MKIPKLFKKAAAFVMAAVTALSIMPATVFAAGDIGTISFSHTYDSNGNAMRYNSSANIGGYTAGGTGNYKYRMFVEGENAFCIQPGVPLKTGNTLKKASSDTWNALSANQKKAVGLALLYGYQGNRNNLSGSDDEKWLATQTLVWEFVTGCREATGSYNQTSTTVYSLHFGSNYANSGARAVYDQIVAMLREHNTIPSFMSGGKNDITKELAYKDGKYSITLTDSNGVLSDYSFSSSDSNVSVSKSGNKLTISSTVAISGSVRITAKRNNVPTVSSIAKLIAYVQDRLIAIHNLDCPWRPSDIEQQEGRILRQGNLNPKVKIFRYVTEGTFDSYSWQLIENKQKFIGQIMTSKSPVRSCEDVDEAALTYAEVKALATGNPYIKEKMDLDIQVSKLKLMKANHTSQKYRLEDNIAKHYPQQITILKECISGMQADIQTAKANLTVDKEQFSMKVGDKLYTDKKEAGTALVEMCKEIKTVNAPAVIGEYAGFKMAVSFDAFNHKFVMNLKEQLSHNLEVGSDPIGNIARINHALESMPKQLMEAQTKLETVEHQLETAKVEVTKPFAQEAELAEKLERLSALNALLNKDEKGNDGIDMDDEPEVPKSEEEVADRPAKHITLAEKTVGTRSDKGIRQYADAPAERVSLKAKLEVMKAKVAGGELERRNSNKKKRKR